MMLLSVNPFIDAYTQSDILGKLIFICLFALSIGSWSVIVYAAYQTYSVKRAANRFSMAFQRVKHSPLHLPSEGLAGGAYGELYHLLRRQVLELLEKNQRYGAAANAENEKKSSWLSLSDIECVENYLSAAIAAQIHKLERRLAILATTVSLAPFLGLLGTVWGILITFSHLQSGHGNSHQAVLGGLSLALATTVVGLIDAIPALIGYNFLRHQIKDIAVAMDGFAADMVLAVDRQYRQVDVRA